MRALASQLCAKSYVANGSLQVPALALHTVLVPRVTVFKRPVLISFYNSTIKWYKKPVHWLYFLTGETWNVMYFHRYQVFYGDKWETELWLSLRLVWSSMCWNRPELSKLICFIHIWVFRNYLWYEKQHRLLLLQRPTKHLYLLRRHPKICNGQVDALDSKLYLVLLTVTRPIMTTSVDSAHVKTLQVGVSFCYYFIIKSLFFSSWLSACSVPLSCL